MEGLSRLNEHLPSLVVFSGLLSQAPSENTD